VSATAGASLHISLTSISTSPIFSTTPYLPGGAPLSYVGLQSPYILSSGAGTPRWRGSWSNSFTYEAATVTGILYYTSGLGEFGVDAFGPGTAPANCIYPNAPDNCHMPEFWDFDLTGSYKFTTISNCSVRSGISSTRRRRRSGRLCGRELQPDLRAGGIVGRFFSIGVRVAY